MLRTRYQITGGETSDIDVFVDDEGDLFLRQDDDRIVVGAATVPDFIQAITSLFPQAIPPAAPKSEVEHG
jgi:hypothetical protein